MNFVAFLDNMQTNRTYFGLSKTILIVLGIILACLLTFNVQKFNSRKISAPKTDQHPTTLEKRLVQKKTTKGIHFLFQKFAKKSHL